MVRTLDQTHDGIDEKNQFILRVIEDIKQSSEALLTKTKEIIDVIVDVRSNHSSAGAETSPPDDAAPVPASPADMLAVLAKMRAIRDSHFDRDLFADPAWEMILDLGLARLSGKQVSVSSLCVAAGVPATTALRRIDDIVARGIAQRIKDPSDGRRVYVALTDDGFRRVVDFLAALTPIVSVVRPKRSSNGSR